MKRQPARPRGRRHRRRGDDGRGGRQGAARRDDARGGARAATRRCRQLIEMQEKLVSARPASPSATFAAAAAGRRARRGRRRLRAPTLRDAPSTTRQGRPRRRARRGAQASWSPSSARSIPTAAKRSSRFFEKELEEATCASRSWRRACAPTAAGTTEIRPIWCETGRAAAHARLGALHARPDAGAQHRHARLTGRRADASTASAPTRASATCTTTTSRPSPSARRAPRAAPAAARSATARWPSARCCR